MFLYIMYMVVRNSVVCVVVFEGVAVFFASIDFVVNFIVGVIDVIIVVVIVVFFLFYCSM